MNLFQHWFFKNEIWNIFLVVTGPRIGPRTGPQNRFQHQFLTNFVNKFWQKTNSQLIENKTDRLERCVRDAEAGGSNPLTPTIFFAKKWSTKPQGFSSLSRQAQLHIFTRRQPLFTELRKPCLWSRSLWSLVKTFRLRSTCEVFSLREYW